MNFLSRLLLIVTAIVGTAFLLIRVELAGVDWHNCFTGLSVREPITWTFAVRVLTRPDILLFAAPVVPTLLAIALSRRWQLQALAFSPMAILLVLVLDQGAMHHCDRKGCTGCDGIAVWVLVFQLPFTTVLVFGLLVARLMEALSRARSHATG